MSYDQPNSIRAVTSDGAGRLVVSDLAPPDPGPGEALIRVSAVSLNRGEVKVALGAAAGWRPGWDYAGAVVQPARDGGGPPAGARVVGFAPSGGWSELVAASPPFLAALPDQVSFEAASTLPVAAGTASMALTKGAAKPGRRVLITGASGGVGVYAIQLAAAAGDEVTAWIRNPANAALTRELGAAHVTIGAALASDIGPFDLILDSVGGQSLGTALGLLAPGGACVLLGASEGAVTSFDASKFRVGGTSLYALAMNWELQHTTPSAVLAGVVALAAEGRLKPVIERRAPIEDIDAVARELVDRKFAGKAVLTF
ncbi:MAG TPA: zinc-binding dehydrogenase [Caulobacteraceae bacterium]|nr:zinc-binding dehydrogenase [Caulobacteraceae bacterium]